MSTDWLGSQDFWHNKRVCVTGGAGFLGSYVAETLRVRERGCGEVFVPRSKDYDLTQLPAVQRLYGDARPDIVIHPSTLLPAPPVGVGDFAPLARDFARQACRLTCVEQGVTVVTKQRATPGMSAVVIDGA